jgi:hypothetical protein
MIAHASFLLAWRAAIVECWLVPVFVFEVVTVCCSGTMQSARSAIRSYHARLLKCRACRFVDSLSLKWVEWRPAMAFWLTVPLEALEAPEALPRLPICLGTRTCGQLHLPTPPVADEFREPAKCHRREGSNGAFRTHVASGFACWDLCLLWLQVSRYSVWLLVGEWVTLPNAANSITVSYLIRPIGVEQNQIPAIEKW